MATSTPYINGLKKPLNMMEAPVFPDIRKGPPRFKWSKKHWTVDTGATMMSTEPFTQMIENAVLAQSRDYNKTIYGQSSHRDVVNAEFRPPLISYYEDVGPLNRVPTKIQSLVPRVNPTTASQGGTSGYLAKNDRPSDIEKALTDRVKRGEERPTFYAPYEVPQDNSILPDLEKKLPSVSLTSGWMFDYKATLTPKEIELREKLASVPLKPGMESALRITGKSDLENYQARNTRPQISVYSGENMPIFNRPQHIETFEFGKKLPTVSVDSGINTMISTFSEENSMDPRLFSNLNHKRPQISVDSGKQSSITSSNFETFEENIGDLSYKRPQISVDSGKQSSITSSNFETPINDLDYVLPQVSVDSGKYSSITSSNFETPVNDLDYVLPQISVDSGKYSSITSSNFETPVNDLDYVLPQISVDSGKHFDYHSEYPEQSPVHLSEKLSSVPIHISNPGTDQNTYLDLDSLSHIDQKYINQKHINYSYEVNKEVPVYRDRNVLSKKLDYHEKIEPLKSYSSGHSQSGSFMPKFGIETPRTTLKERKNKYAVNRKVSTYKI